MGMKTICFGYRIRHCPQNVGFIHYLCFITATTFKTPDYGQVSEATTLECDVPSSESYTEVLRLMVWMMVLKVSLIFFAYFCIPHRPLSTRSKSLSLTQFITNNIPVNRMVT